ncbi:hypothetical protein FIBSPDRAFT_870963 [Athelia psychrophila]|uniref:Uncharacterized protein n=1 Tax=Athelia psychrophila TaxID=1759441 RepID=A0A167UV96_9AGAM|nr:hypothetical protein FIBSPDRAFT_878620 [Fibularhizoctonia sp. CBS 109695]KZP11825.1 hypothetical protein FIBSPDRAFT_870963 [Fibularhizoctonia sp. CBS 109695]
MVRTPPVSGSGASMNQADCTILASGGYDSITCLVDARDPQGIVLNRTQGVPIPTMAFWV